jgi:zinc transporter 9
VDWDATVIFCWNVLVSSLLYLKYRRDTYRCRYVAMHAMQEDSNSEHSHSSSNGYIDGTSSQRNKPKPQMRDTLAAVGGMLIPLLTQIGHHH